MSLSHVEDELKKVNSDIEEAEKDPRSAGHPRRWSKESAMVVGFKIRKIILEEAIALFKKE